MDGSIYRLGHTSRQCCGSRYTESGSGLFVESLERKKCGRYINNKNNLLPGMSS
jgi:hypothetical protein